MLPFGYRRCSLVGSAPENANRSSRTSGVDPKQRAQNLRPWWSSELLLCFSIPREGTWNALPALLVMLHSRPSISTLLLSPSVEADGADGLFCGDGDNGHEGIMPGDAVSPWSTVIGISTQSLCPSRSPSGSLNGRICESL